MSKKCLTSSGTQLPYKYTTPLEYIMNEEDIKYVPNLQVHQERQERVIARYNKPQPPIKFLSVEEKQAFYRLTGLASETE
jgi:hypothetical protein